MSATATAGEAPPLFDPAACAAAANHGAYVSFVAHATAGLPDHGALVSAAAQSDCGKVAPTATAPTTEAAPQLAPTTTAWQEGSEEGEGHGRRPAPTASRACTAPPSTASPAARQGQALPLISPGRRPRLPADRHPHSL